MLRRQSADRTPMSFLAGNGDMARRIRDFDWSDHPLGPPPTWAQSLRSALGICLNSAFPTAIYWGSDLRLLYNDPWSAIPGPRHPSCLGEPAREVWSDIWHVIEPQFTHIIETGEGVFADDQHLPMRRFGFEEETYWSYSFTPIRGEDGAIEGVFNSGQETTSKVLKQRETALLLRLSDRLRACACAEDVMNTVCQTLGEHLRATRVGIRETDPLAGRLPVRAEWTADGVATAGASLSWADLGSVAARLDAGHAVRVARTGDLEDAAARTFFRLGAAAVLAIPWRGSGELRAVLFVHRAEAHDWSDEEVAVVEQVFERTIHALDRERSEAREKTMLREIDHRARNMLGISHALIRLVKADDVETFRTSLLERMGALGNTLSILSAEQWEGASLEVLLKAELAPYLSDEIPSVTLRGPEVIVVPDKAQPMAMAIHELAVNALKHGALSSPAGTLRVTWEILRDGNLAIDWTERNGKPATGVQRPGSGSGSGSGFGTKLLGMTIESQLGGKLSRHVDQDGFRLGMEIPL